MKITASTLYDYLQCPHKVWRDRYGPLDELIKETNPFVGLLWERGAQHEENIIRQFKYQYEDLSIGTIEERTQRTAEAMHKGTRYIYQGVIQTETLLGIPDILELVEDDGYYPVDIKSGRAYETGNQNDVSQKKNYAVQLCLYNEILIELGYGGGRKGFIIDRSGLKAEYDLTAPLGNRNPVSYWEFYNQIKAEVWQLVTNKAKNDPAMAGACKLCSWYNSCKKQCEASDDLTLIFNVGRRVRDTIKNDLGISTINELIETDSSALLIRKSEENGFLRGVGESMLTKAMTRAKLLKSQSKPVIYKKTVFPKVEWELFWDIEDDPTVEIVYLHGVYVRNSAGGEYRYFLARDLTAEGEKEAWTKFWRFIKNFPPDDFAVYFYSQHEHSTYKRLQHKYPEVISEQKLKAFFDNPNVIDLYKVVLQTTDWPLSSYSIKALASYSGFRWRDETPSGALSIQWFNEYIRTAEEKTLQRILDYNEDDCIATLIIKDKILSIQ